MHICFDRGVCIISNPGAPHTNHRRAKTTTIYRIAGYVIGAFFTNIWHCEQTSNTVEMILVADRWPISKQSTRCPFTNDDRYTWTVKSYLTSRVRLYWCSLKPMAMTLSAMFVDEMHLMMWTGSQLTDSKRMNGKTHSKTIPRCGDAEFLVVETFGFVGVIKRDEKRTYILQNYWLRSTKPYSRLLMRCEVFWMRS